MCVEALQKCSRHQTEETPHSRHNMWPFAPLHIFAQCSCTVCWIAVHRMQLIVSSKVCSVECSVQYAVCSVQCAICRAKLTTSEKEDSV